ncbi:MAG: response regulator [Candidatus Omnitrophica bacterium]|nr:response regulator [Candidatus Omnitrophota bacterium]MDD5671810.1 response regulator [Candidatus Omnitrophota bacterium]
MPQPKLLVIDDEQGVLDMIRGHFEPRGFEVYTALDGREGIRICEQVRPGMILLDLKMKGLDGDQACPELRRLVPQARIFLVTAYEDEIVAKRGAALGIDAVFEKPISILKLEKEIRAALGLAKP